MKEIKHGTNAGAAMERYYGLPICDECRQAKNAYMRLCKERGKIREYVDAEPIRLHILSLLDCGLTLNDVAEAAGVPPTSISNLFGDSTGRFKRVWKRNADRILEVSPDWARGTLVPVYVVERRMQALMYMGWTHRDLTRVGINLPDDRFGGSTVQESVARRWDEAYQKYGSTPGPSIKATFKAYRNDWAPASCWEDSIDDPYALPLGRACVTWCGKDAVRRSLCIEHDLEVGECDASAYSGAVRRIRNQLTRGLAA